MKVTLVTLAQEKRPDTKDPRQVALYQLQTLPVVLQNIQQGVVQFAIWWMRMLGVTKVMSKSTLLGIRTFSDVSFKAMTEQPPEELRTMRNNKVRMIADCLADVGIAEIEIIPDEKEVKELIEHWQKIMKPPAVPAPVPANVARLNTETDPTGDKVIKDGNEQPKPTAESPAVVAVPAISAAPEVVATPVVPAGQGV